MTQPEHSGRRPSRRRGRSRTHSTRPTPARPGGRRAGERRAWPTAPTTTRVSPASTVTGSARSRPRGSASTLTPATVWTAGPRPIDLHARWPAALLDRIVTSFSEPGASVVLLAWPPPHHHRPTLVPAGPDSAAGGVVDRASGTEPDLELAAAVHGVEHLGRTVRVEHIPVGQRETGTASRPFWADLIGGSGPASATVPATPVAPTVTVEGSASHDSTDASRVASGGADLVITSLPSALSGDRRDRNSADTGADVSADLVALFAAHLLRVGGILVVLTHCDWTRGELIDPTGAVVAAGQNADLLYLQHIVAVHAPIRDGQFVLADEHPAGDSSGDSDGDAGGAEARGRHRAVVHAVPAPHRRIHSDVLVFAQPHDHQPPAPLATDRPTAACGGELKDSRRTPRRIPTSPISDRTARKARP